MLREGYIKWHRNVVDWEWYKDIPVHILFEHLILCANWFEQKWQGRTIKRGQLVTSIMHLSNDTGLTIQQVRTALKKLEKNRRNNKRNNKQI